MRSVEFWQAAASGTLELQSAVGARDPLVVGDFVTMTSVEGPTKIEDTVVRQLYQQYGSILTEPEVNAWRFPLTVAEDRLDSVRKSPLATRLKLSKASQVLDPRGINVALILPFDGPDFEGDETPASPPGVDFNTEEFDPAKLSLGVAVVTSRAVRLKRMGHDTTFDPGRQLAIARYWATWPSQRQSGVGIVRREVFTTPKWNTHEALGRNHAAAGETPEAVAASALRWVVARGKYEVE